MWGRSSRALSVMKMLSASESTAGDDAAGAAHTAEAADDVVIAGGFDGLEGPALFEQLRQVAGDEDLGPDQWW
jgi:hypothetical protein